jgi:hypothetical protein
MKMKKLGAVSFLATVLYFLVISGAHASIVGGNSIEQRTTRDGAANITFIDLNNTIQIDSTITGWNIWAQDYAVHWPYSTAPRELKLIIFRSNYSSFEVVGKSGLEKVSVWNQSYHFDLTSPIDTLAGDFIGWYYPITNYPVPGGLISFGGGASQTAFLYGDEMLQSTPPLSSFTIENRTYSINVEGNPVPVPASLLLFGSGLAGLAVTRLRRRKQ